MIKKVFLCICILITPIAIGISSVVQAENVKEYIEGNTDPSEINGSTPNELKTDQENNTEEVAGTGSLIKDILKMVFALFLILILIYLLLRFLKKRNKLFHQIEGLENLGGISVGQNKSIQIVRIGTKVYMIGVGENVEMLHEIIDEEVKKDLLHNIEERADFHPGTLFKSFFKKTTESERQSDHQATNQFKTLFTNELEKLKQNRKNIINQHKQKEDTHE